MMDTNVTKPYNVAIGQKFATVVIAVNNLKTGKTFRAGNFDIEVLKGSLGIT